MGKALANAHRLELLDLLCQGPRTVEALSEQVEMSLASTSQHLQVLRAARLVDAEKNGLYVTYRIADEGVCALFVALRATAQTRLAEVEELRRSYLGTREELEPLDKDELLSRVRQGAVTVLDVRPEQEYRAGHLPGAISIPINEIERRLASLPKRRLIVAYCRGPYCVYAVDAVKTLRDRGYRAVRLDEGVVEWQARGLPLES
jgi:rhodanese-related sulfurtransferase